MDSTNLKIVCIVQNSTNMNEGLVRTFGHNRYSTINSFIKKHLYDFEDNEFYTHFGYENKNKYLLITKEKVIVQASLKQGDHWEILFICDKIALDAYPPFIFTPDTLLMYHQQPVINGNAIDSIHINGRNLSIKKGKKGQHEALDKGYQRLFALTEAWKKISESETYAFDKDLYEAAKKNIIDWFDLNDKLNAALEFLHQSLGGTVAGTNILTNDNLFDLTKTIDDKTIQFWIDELSNPKDDYDNALRNLRDVLLKEAGVE